MKKWRRLAFVEIIRIYTFVLKLDYSIKILRRKEGDVIVFRDKKKPHDMAYIKL